MNRREFLSSLLLVSVASALPVELNAFAPRLAWRDALKAEIVAGAMRGEISFDTCMELCQEGDEIADDAPLAVLVSKLLN